MGDGAGVLPQCRRRRRRHDVQRQRPHGGRDLLGRRPGLQQLGVSPYSMPLQFTVPLACTSSISPTGISAPAAGTSGSLTVSTPAGCAWSAASASSFLTFQNGTGRTGIRNGHLHRPRLTPPPMPARSTGTVAGKSSPFRRRAPGLHLLDHSGQQQCAGHRVKRERRRNDADRVRLECDQCE